MELNEFFTKEELIEIDVFGQKFKYKPVTAGDELDWAEDYIETKIIKQKVGNVENVEKVVRNQNLSKLSICKLRNITEVPFSKEQIQSMAGIDKEYKDFTTDEKDLFFRKFNPKVYNSLIKIIDELGKIKKKD